MTSASLLIAIARADFLERARRPGFLVTMAVTLYAAFIFLPPHDAPYATMQFGGHRGIYNSAWVGSVVALLSSIFLSMTGFYLVKNAVDGDRRSGVGPILAGTPVSKLSYVVGKALSNLTILMSIVALLVVGAGVMQWIRAEDLHIDPLELIAPFVFITLPTMAMVAAVAVLFEVVPGLRGGPGNVAYFFLWSFGMVQSSLRRSSFDLLGAGFITPGMAAACKRAFTDYDMVRMPMSLGLTFKSSGHWDLTTFSWQGVDWTGAAIVGRMTWLGVAFATCALAAFVFDRFDAAAAPSRPRRGWSFRARTASEAPVSEGALREIRLSPLREPLDFALAPFIVAELKLMLRAIPWLGILVALGLMVASIFAPRTAVTRGILPALWILPLFLWSALGNREKVHGVHALLRSVPRPVVRPWLAQWSAGALLALVLALGVMVRWAVAGDFTGLAGLLVGAAFVPALALALGEWSGSPKLFEVVYLLLWYMGPVNRAPGLDYTGGETTPLGVLAWAAVTMACMAAGIAARRRR